MCGRFVQRTPVETLARVFDLVEAAEAPVRFNVAPTQSIAGIRLTSRGRELAMLRWGLIPSWAKDRKIGASLINARAETVAEKPAFRAAFKQRRCLIPATGYYEWQAQGSRKKQPYLIHARDDSPFAFAGLWERWQGPDETGHLESCTILTTDAAPELRPLHDRMPVILPATAYDLWLDPQSKPADLLPLLRPFKGAAMEAYPVDPARVNSARYDGPECTNRIHV